MKLIKQRSRHDCGAAVLAMATGLDLDEVERRLGHRCEDPVAGLEGEPDQVAIGVSDEECMRFLFEAGGRPVYLATRELFADFLDLSAPSRKSRHQRLLYDSDEIKAKVLLAGAAAILAVGSRNIAGSCHYILWDGAALLDPTWGTPYERIEELRIYSAIVL